MIFFSVKRRSGEDGASFDCREQQQFALHCGRVLWPKWMEKRGVGGRMLCILCT